MEESTRLTDNRQRTTRVEFGDDECSTDSGCSSGGSTGSAERLSRRGSGERLCGRSPRGYCYLDRLRSRPTTTRSQERLSRTPRSAERVRSKPSRSWSPTEGRLNSSSATSATGTTTTRSTDNHNNGTESPLHSPSPSDAQSSSDSDSLKRPSTAETLRRAFQSLKISTRWENNNNHDNHHSGNSNGNKEKKHVKKCPKRILRSPVSYTYVRGLSGLPTQRVPRNTAQQLMVPCNCQESIGLYR